MVEPPVIPLSLPDAVDGLSGFLLLLDSALTSLSRISISICLWAFMHLCSCPPSLAGPRTLLLHCRTRSGMNGPTSSQCTCRSLGGYDCPPRRVACQGGKTSYRVEIKKYRINEGV